MISNLNMRTVIMILLLVGTVQMVSSQTKGKEQQIISSKVNIQKYHDREELLELNKGKLLDLYIKRIDLIIKILPNIAFCNLFLCSRNSTRKMGSRGKAHVTFSH